MQRSCAPTVFHRQTICFGHVVVSDFIDQHQLSLLKATVLAVLDGKANTSGQRSDLALVPPNAGFDVGYSPLPGGTIVLVWGTIVKVFVVDVA